MGIGVSSLIRFAHKWLLPGLVPIDLHANPGTPPFSSPLHNQSLYSEQSTGLFLQNDAEEVGLEPTRACALRQALSGEGGI